MDNTNQVEALLRQLDAQRDAYLAAFQQIHELLVQNVAKVASVPSAVDTAETAAATPPRSPVNELRSPRPSISRPTSEREVHARKTSTGLTTLQTSSASRATGDDSDDDEDVDYYVQTALEPQSYDHEGLRKHLRTHTWTVFGKKMLGEVLSASSRLSRGSLFPTQRGPAADRSHLSHYQVFDVGGDGAPLPVELLESERPPSHALTIWHTIKDLNKPDKERKAVGRISIMRELSPILSGAIHYAMNRDFDMDEIFGHLVESESSSANMHRAFDSDERRQRSFIFNFEYFTIIGEECEPFEWQLADRQKDRHEHHIPISRCSSVVALSLQGKVTRKIKNPSRRAKNPHGFAYEVFAPWKVLNIQHYPDWRSRTDIHDSTKHYVNGVEAFMATLLGEFQDAQKRFEDIYKKIAKLITPELDFMFNADIRDRLLFEDSEFTYSRRYFWAVTTLGIVNNSIKAMIDAYEDTFTDEVWEGRHRTLWPLMDQTGARNVYYKKKMAFLRKKFDVELNSLRIMMKENDDLRDEIKSLREELYTGTSIQESRKSVENTEITVLQGHNIKILTLVCILSQRLKHELTMTTLQVSIFFLPVSTSQTDTSLRS